MAIIPPSIANAIFTQINQKTVRGFDVWTDQSAPQNNIVRVLVVPQDIRFSQKARISEQVVQDGKVFYFWQKDLESKHLDLMEIEVLGLTLNQANWASPAPPASFQQLVNNVTQPFTDLYGQFTTPDKPPTETRLTEYQWNWRRFWSMTREPYVTTEGLNRAHIRFNTPGLPETIQFIGHFSEPLSWQQTVDNPNIIQWQFRFVVHQTIPDLDQFLKTGGDIWVTQ